MQKSSSFISDTSLRIIRTNIGDESFHLFDKIKQGAPIVEEYLRHIYVLLENEKPITRVALYDNPHLSYEDKKTALLGYYECLGEAEVAQIFLEEVLKKIKQLSYECVIGPMNGSTWNDYRFVSNEGESFFLEPQNPLSYPQHFEQIGFRSIAQYYSSKGKTFAVKELQIIEGENKFQEQGVRFRSLNLEDYEQELKKIHEFSLDSFKQNFLFSPISWKTFRDKYLPLKNMVNPEFVLFAEDKNKKLVGLVFAIQDIFCQTEKRIIAKTIARNPAPKYQGLGELMVLRFVERTNKAGFASIIHALIIESGLSQHVSEKCFGERFKTYNLYGKML